MTLRLVRVPKTDIADPSDLNRAEIDSSTLNKLAKGGWQLLSIAVDPETQDVIAAMEQETKVPVTPTKVVAL